jgi:hypothetical protein
VFAFILAITEVNMYLAYKYFVWKTTTTISFLRFRCKLAKALIYNEYMSLDEEDDVTPRKSKRQRRQQDHVKQTVPNHARYFDEKKWVIGSSDRYQKYTCKAHGCKKLIRTYCRCSPGVWLCEDHFVQHRIEVSTVPESPQPN